MFGIDSPELLVIAVVALVVIGPKELPGMLRSWGKWMAQMRGMASEFRGHVDEMVRQADIDDVKKQLTATPGLDLQALSTSVVAGVVSKLPTGATIDAELVAKRTVDLLTARLAS